MKLSGPSIATWLLACAVVLAGCSASPPAPVVDRSASSGPRALPVDGLYRVRRGDSLHVISFSYGLDWRDLAAWNGIRSPYTIFPEQILRLKPPPRSASQPVGKQPARDVAASRPEPSPARPKETSASGTGSARSTAWVWPTDGRLLRTFKPGDPARNGLDIAGSEGQPVQAAAPGDVVYSGDGLIGYGELVIIKHSELVLSAYAHNRRRLVQEGDRVNLGQKIAELGRNDRNEQILHFEIRVSGKPVDPRNYLPKQ